MPRQAKGELRSLADGGWEARITIQGRQRLGLMLLSSLGEAEAEERCRLLARLAQRLRKAGHVAEAPALLRMAAVAHRGEKLAGVLGAVDAMCTGSTEESKSPKSPITFQGFGQDWTSGKLHLRWPDYIRKKRTSTDDKLRLEKQIYPIVGHVRLDQFTVAHADAVMARLPATLSKASRRQYAQLMHRVLAMAAYPARIIATNPLPRGFLPKLGKRKTYPILYPANDAQLLGSAAVHLNWRMFFGWLHREGGRMDEAISLQWRDLDLAVGTVQIDENKTDKGRPPWMLNRGVANALKIYKERFRPEAQPEDKVFIDEYGRPIDSNHMADRVRAAIEAAGLKEVRPDLFERGVNRGRFGTHGYRRSFVTLHIDNHGERWCMDRTGHETRTQLDQYRQMARTVAELGLGELHPLDEVIPELITPRKPHKFTAPVAQLDRASDFESPASQLDSRSAEKTSVSEAGETPPKGSLGQSVAEWGNPDALDAALVRALDVATEAKDLDAVREALAEIRAHRLARAGDGVVDLAVRRDRERR